MIATMRIRLLSDHERIIGDTVVDSAINVD